MNYFLEVIKRKVVTSDLHAHLVLPYDPTHLNGKPLQIIGSLS